MTRGVADQHVHGVVGRRELGEGDVDAGLEARSVQQVFGRVAG